MARWISEKAERWLATSPLWSRRYSKRDTKEEMLGESQSREWEELTAFASVRRPLKPLVGRILEQSRDRVDERVRKQRVIVNMGSGIFRTPSI